MSGLQPNLVDDEPESPSTLPSSPSLSTRRHQQQQQQANSTSTTITTGFTREQYHHHLALSSDADASSDFSELELHRHAPSSSFGADDGIEGYSDFETPLPSRWDLAAHLHIGDYYSEGVEGDADDDDEEERDLDTDVSEGPGPGFGSGFGPGLRARRGTNSRRVQLDMARIQDILSSPIISPLGFDAALSSRSDTSTGAGRGRLIGPMFNTNRIDDIANLDSFSSSAGEDILSRQHHFHRTYLSHHSLTERSVRFSRDTAFASSRVPLTPQPNTDISPSTSGLETMDPELLPFISEPTTNNIYTGDENTIPLSRPITEGMNDILNNLRHNQSSLRLQSNEGLDYQNQARISGFSRLTDYTGYESNRLQSTQHLVLSEADNNHTHTASGSGTNFPQQQIRHHSLTLAATNRHGPAYSPRNYTSPYWSALERYRRHSSQSPRYSSTSSQTSSSSSRIASPVLDPQFTVIKNPEIDDNSNENDVLMRQQDKGLQPEQPTVCSTLASFSGSRISRKASRISHGDNANRQQLGTNRRGTSISSNNHKVTSLPSFASTVFMPNILGSTAMVAGEASNSFGLYRRMKSNHPRRPCCFLQAGQKLNGTQSLKTMAPTLSGMRPRQIEEWNVKVSIGAVDYVAGTIYGHMEAMDVPMSVSNVVTFWEGE
ncbi:hypothetical protein FBU30_000790 [Linnemannia zychae]|nr:hypothetical protein FBU30_000790 [Linnemannia zychae]